MEGLRARVGENVFPGVAPNSQETKPHALGSQIPEPPTCGGWMPPQGSPRMGHRQATELAIAMTNIYVGRGNRPAPSFCVSVLKGRVLSRSSIRT